MSFLPLREIKILFSMEKVQQTIRFRTVSKTYNLGIHLAYTYTYGPNHKNNLI